MATSLHTFIDIFETSFDVDGESVQLKSITIPAIQRDYAQGRRDPEIERVRNRFLNSLFDAIVNDAITLDFVYGDIDDTGCMTPLDGQQRLTTLFLLHWYAAKKECVNAEEWDFLSHFSYKTRYSARDFCSFLVRFDPTFDGPVSEEIIDQTWFPLDWKKDPTIASMLVMLDAIQEKFASLSSIWPRLKEGAMMNFSCLTNILLLGQRRLKKTSQPWRHISIVGTGFVRRSLRFPSLGVYSLLSMRWERFKLKEDMSLIFLRIV